MKTKLIHISSNPVKPIFPALFQCKGDCRYLGEIILVTEEDGEGTVIHSVCDGYPIGHIYRNTRFLTNKEWVRIHGPVTIEFNSQ